MKRIEVLSDYSEHLIKADKILRNINSALLDDEYDLAKLLANELKITAMLMYDSIERQEI